MTTLLKELNYHGDGWSKTALNVQDDFGCYSTRKIVQKTQCNYYCRPWWNALRKTPIVKREMRALIALRKLGLRVPLVLGYSGDLSESTLLTTYIEGSCNLSEALLVPDARRNEIVGGTASLIGSLHRARWTHGALYPEHLLVTDPSTKPQVHLIDLEKAKYLGSREKDLQRFYRYENVFLPEERRLFDETYSAELKGEPSSSPVTPRAQ